MPTPPTLLDDLEDALGVAADDLDRWCREDDASAGRAKTDGDPEGLAGHFEGRAVVAHLAADRVRAVLRTLRANRAGPRPTGRPTVYVVMGTTGEYSERREWPVCGYADEAAAQQHVLKAGAAARRLHHTAYGRAPFTRVPQGANPYDPAMRMGTEGTTYFYHAVPVREALPDALRPGAAAPG